MPSLVVNADDFGMCQGTNVGILRAHVQGIVTSATLMVNMPGAAEAFQIARSTPALGVGLHMNLTAGRPLSPGASSLTGPDGRFLKLPMLAQQARPEEVEQELRAQAAAFLAAGLLPTHLDSHHHVHLEIPSVGIVVDRLALELGVPVRGRGTAPDLIVRFYGREQVTIARLQAILTALPRGSTSEIMCHPAYLDPELLLGSSYGVERVYELMALTAPAVLETVAERKLKLVGFRDLV